MKLRTLLNELFDSKPYPFKRKMISGNKKGTPLVSYGFTSSKSGAKYAVQLEPAGTGVVEVGFHEAFHSYDAITGYNEISAVLATVMGTVMDYHKDFGDAVTSYRVIGTPKDLESGAGARHRIYLAFIKRMLPSGWNIKHDNLYIWVYPKKG